MNDETLRRLAVERVMGWQIDGVVIVTPESHPMKLKLLCDWNPLTDWSAAGEIAEMMQNGGWSSHIHLSTLHDGTLYNTATFEKRRKSVNVKAEVGWELKALIPRAITIAALLAVGAITEDQLTETEAS